MQTQPQRRAWFQRNKERWYGPTVQHNRLKRIYGITLEEYQEIWDIQQGLCAICKKPESSQKGKKLAVDHDHSTNKIRGLLCFNCNTAMGGFKENKELLRKAADYLEWYEQITA